MKRISAYKTSPIFVISVNYGGELVSFNLARELRIDIDQIDEELRKQPNHYGFCLLIHKTLLSKFETYKMLRKKTYGRLFIAAKSKKVNGRFMSDDVAKCYVESHPKYINISMKCIKTKDEADKMYSCIRAFEQRKDLMQSISSNRRAEKL